MRRIQLTINSKKINLLILTFSFAATAGGSVQASCVEGEISNVVQQVEVSKKDFYGKNEIVKVQKNSKAHIIRVDDKKRLVEFYIMDDVNDRYINGIGETQFAKKILDCQTEMNES